jgi:hypothetical protein
MLAAAAREEDGRNARNLHNLRILPDRDCGGKAAPHASRRADKPPLFFKLVAKRPPNAVGRVKQKLEILIYLGDDRLMASLQQDEEMEHATSQSPLGPMGEEGPGSGDPGLGRYRGLICRRVDNRVE